MSESTSPSPTPTPKAGATPVPSAEPGTTPSRLDSAGVTVESAAKLAEPAPMPPGEEQDDTPRLIYRLELVGSDGKPIVKICSKSYGVPLDGLLDKMSIETGASIETLNHLVRNVIAEPFLRRANAHLNKLHPDDPMPPGLGLDEFPTS